MPSMAAAVEPVASSSKRCEVTRRRAAVSIGKDFDELKLAAGGMFVIHEADIAGADFRDLTSELLEATIALTHPDKHPAERKAEANRVTQELQALQAIRVPGTAAESHRQSRVTFVQMIYGDDLSKPSQPAYPCEDCRDAIPMTTATPARRNTTRKRQEETSARKRRRERKNARQRERYKPPQTLAEETCIAPPDTLRDVRQGVRAEAQRCKVLFCRLSPTRLREARRQGIKFKTTGAAAHRTRDRGCVHGQSRQRLHHR